MKQFSDLQIEYNATDKKYKMALDEFNILKKKVRKIILVSHAESMYILIEYCMKFYVDYKSQMDMFSTYCVNKFLYPKYLTVPFQEEETREKLQEREQKVIELEQLCKRNETEISQLKHHNNDQNALVLTKEEEIAKLQQELKEIKEYVILVLSF